VRPLQLLKLSYAVSVTRSSNLIKKNRKTMHNEMIEAFSGIEAFFRQAAVPSRRAVRIRDGVPAGTGSTYLPRSPQCRAYERSSGLQQG
jgi:hypothetical protein